MHREALSRLYSHTLIGKPVTVLSCRTAVAFHGTGTNGHVLETGSARRYHRTWEKRSQSVTSSVLAEGREKGLGAALPFDGESKSLDQQPAKVFNLKAKDILSTPDEPRIKFQANQKIDDSHSVANHSLLESRIYSTRSVDELLRLSNEQELTLKHACLIISQLGHTAQGKGDNHRAAQKIRSDERFVKIFNLVQRGNHSHFPHTLLQALTGLQKLGMETSSEVSNLLERELSWSMRRCPLRFLAKSVRILHDNANPGDRKTVTGSVTAKEQSVLQSAIQVLHRRWIEAANGGDFISLFQVIDLFDDEKKLKIEERAADIAHQFSPAEMLKIFVVLGSKKRRPTPLLRALAFHFSKSEYKASAKEAIELVYALNELTFADPILMNRLCTDLAEEIPQINNSALISSLVTSLGQMRYKNKDVLFAVDEWIMKHLKSLRVFDYAAWLQTTATLNYQSTNLASFCKRAREVLTSSSSSCPAEWVNIVHSFVILDEYDSDMLASVLEPAFVDRIDKIGSKAGRQKVKLLNLNHIASQRGNKYTGQFLKDDKVKQWALNLVCCSDEKLSKLVVDSLGTFLPPKKYLTLNCQLESGVFVDAECHFDNKMAPITLEAAQSRKESETTKVSFVVEGYPALCIGLKDRTGSSELNKRILESDNLVVISVPYTEFGLGEKLVKRVQYLEQKIKAVSSLGETSA